MMTKDSIDSLHTFIIRAKSATYVGSGAASVSFRPGSHDLQYQDGEWAYLDSYFGGHDFIGEEVIYHSGRPVWAMNYYGYILNDELITPEQAGHMIKSSLSRMYREGRFLGGFNHEDGDFTYIDTSEGDVIHFHGTERIQVGGEVAYELVYHGGLIK